MTTQAAKALAFQVLHRQPDAFIIPNPWDQGSARLLEILGFKALATTSAGFAFSRGKSDNHVSREQVLEHLADLVAVTSLPISADLENGFGESHAVVADTIRLAAQAGVVGGSLARAALGAFMSAAEELRDHGSFTYADRAIPMATINQLLA